ncbi:MAG: serine hydrolase [Acidimicrobiales bacterium]
MLGSVFKLWLLADLADRIAAGEATWDEKVPVDDRYKSSPDGEVFTMEPGTEISLEELAMLMISISDNSATDHLMAYLGRDRVEAVLDRIGVADPAANVPMLSTQALFQLKFVAAGPSSDDWRALDEEGRRTLLADIDEAVLPWVQDPDAFDLINADGVPVDQPRDLDLEWFATPGDLCRTLTYLADRAETPGLEPVAAILEANPGLGLPFDRDRWPTIRFKGGSEPGVVAGAWWFEGDDGRRYVVAGGLADPESPVPEIDGALALASAITLVS